MRAKLEVALIDAEAGKMSGVDALGIALDEADALADDVTILRDGRVLATGTPADIVANPEVRRDVATVIDDLDFFPDLSVVEHLDLLARAHGLVDPDALVDEVLEEVQLVPQAGQLPSTLSSGQRRRLALATALVQPADLLLLDEPTNHLDSETIAWLEEYLRGQKGALLMVTHDRYFLDNTATKILELDKGSAYTYTGNYSSFLEQKEARIEREEASEQKRQNFLRNELKWLRRGAQARSTKQRARIERYEEVKNKKVDLDRSTARLDRARVLLEAGAEAVVLRVQDSGPGVAPELRGKVFERFFRAGGGSGAGLGLSIVARIVELHHGTITLGDSPFGGLEVWVRLPRATGGVGAGGAPGGSAD